MITKLRILGQFHTFFKTSLRGRNVGIFAYNVYFVRSNIKSLWFYLRLIFTNFPFTLDHRQFLPTLMLITHWKMSLRSGKLYHSNKNQPCLCYFSHKRPSPFLSLSSMHNANERRTADDPLTSVDDASSSYYSNSMIKMLLQVLQSKG